METIEATFRVVTPMFMGGAEPKNGKAELRLPSLKGALRFWWRALAWEGFNSTLPKLTENLSEIRRLEAEIFGSADQDIGQAGVLIKLKNETPPDVKLDLNGLPGAIYLAYGVAKSRGETERDYLCDPFSFSLSMLLKPKAVAYKESILASLKALGLFGAAGSKARKGYGSLTLTSLKSSSRDGDTNHWDRPITAEALKTAITALVGQPKGKSLPPYTAFSQSSRIDVLAAANDLETEDNSLELLNTVGKAMQLYRSWGIKRGSQHMVNNKRAKQKFPQDHDEMYEAVQGNDAGVTQHPQRAVFGLPHNYFFSSLKRGGWTDIEARVDVSPAEHNRRASPLFIHIHELDEENFAAVLTLLPADFLPAGEDIKIESLRLKRGKANPVFTTQNADYTFIGNFLSSGYLTSESEDIKLSITRVLP